LPCAEAMASGTLLIASDFSGTTAFADSTNSLPVQCKVIDAAKGCEPDVEVSLVYFRSVLAIVLTACFGFYRGWLGDCGGLTTTGLRRVRWGRRARGTYGRGLGWRAWLSCGRRKGGGASGGLRRSGRTQGCSTWTEIEAFVSFSIPV